VGEPGVFTPDVIMGDSTVSLPDYRLNNLKMYFETSAIDARSRLDLRSILGSVYISAAGSIGSLVSISSSGSISLNTVSDMTANVGGNYNVFGSSQIRLFASTDWQARGSTVDIKSDAVTISKLSTFGNGPTWFEMHSASGYTMTCGLPVTGNANPSIRIAEDAIHAAGTSSVSLNPDGYFRIGPYLDIPGGKIKSSGCGNVTIENLIFDGIITNPTGPVVIDDLDGVDFRDTPIVSTTGDIVIQNYTTFGTTAADILGTTFGFNTLMTGTITATTITATTINGGAGTCCVSDKRMKHNIKLANLASALDTIKQLAIKEYEYTAEYLKTDTWVRNGTHLGVIAQEAKELIPMAVNVREKTVAGKVISDFHEVRYDKFVPYLIAAVQQLSIEINNMKR
jgi:hypothetical protein